MWMDPVRVHKAKEVPVLGPFKTFAKELRCNGKEDVMICSQIFRILAI